MVATDVVEVIEVAGLSLMEDGNGCPEKLLVDFPMIIRGNRRQKNTKRANIE